MPERDANRRNASKEELLSRLFSMAVEYDRGDAKRIQHFVKVHDFARAIGLLEQLDDETQFVLETAAILHDIGIHESEKKYGSCGGKYQELEGPPIAEEMLRSLGGYSEDEISRVKYLIAHHHTYTDIDGMDYQILVEADFLVNLFEDGAGREAIENARRNIFRTQAGLRFLDDMFNLHEHLP